MAMRRWLGRVFVLAVLPVAFLVGHDSVFAVNRMNRVRSINFRVAKSPGSKVIRHSWSTGPLGPVESADAFRIYYLPFVEPLEIEGNILDQLFGGWFGPLAPLLLGVVIFWVQGQINAVRREQEGRVIGSAAKAVGDAAAKTASGAAQSLSEKLQRVPGEQWLKLFLCLPLDLAGVARKTGICMLHEVLNDLKRS